MKTGLYTIYDEKAEFHSAPYSFRSEGEAKRTFAELAVDKNTKIGKTPSDFKLYQIADYNDNTAELLLVHPIKFIANAMEYVKEEVEDGCQG